MRSSQWILPSLSLQLVTSQPYAAGYPATAARYAIPTVASAATYAAAAGWVHLKFNLMSLCMWYILSMNNFEPVAQKQHVFIYCCWLFFTPNLRGVGWIPSLKNSLLIPLLSLSLALCDNKCCFASSSIHCMACLLLTCQVCGLSIVLVFPMNWPAIYVCMHKYLLPWHWTVKLNIFLIVPFSSLFRYGRDYAADPYLGHSIGPVAGFGVSSMHPLSDSHCTMATSIFTHNSIVFASINGLFSPKLWLFLLLCARSPVSVCALSSTQCSF